MISKTIHYLGGLLRETQAAGSRIKDDGPVCIEDTGRLPVHSNRIGREIPVAIGRWLSDKGQLAFELRPIDPTKGQFGMTNSLWGQEKTELCCSCSQYK
jgi:hypothetical protein